MRDPVARARLAGELINAYQQQGVELARIRKEAINIAAAEHGLSFSEIAQQLELTRGRISQIRKSAPPAERAFFGVGPITVAYPTRDTPGRAMPVVSVEDQIAADNLVQLLEDLAFKVTKLLIPPDGKWEPPAGDVVAICGPLSSQVTAVALDSDPFLDFTEEPDTGLWTIRDRTTGDRFASPIDLNKGAKDLAEVDWTDYAYVGRLAYKDRTLLIIAGIHALGSVGAVDYLAHHAPEVYAEVGTDRFSMVTRSEHEPLTRAVETSELACPPRRHG